MADTKAAATGAMEEGGERKTFLPAVGLAQADPAATTIFVE